MQDKILTISIAAYNIEKYIDKLIKSIVASGRIDKIEILIVNDGSKDNTLDIATEYANKYPSNIYAIDKENGGHGSTINKGIELAQGKYFKPIDGDDWVNSEDLMNLIDQLEHCESELVLANYEIDYEKTNASVVRKLSVPADIELSFDENCSLLHDIRYYNIFYKTSILKEHNIRLTEHSFYVDNEFDAYPIPYINTLTYYDLTVYCYRLGRDEQSVSLSSLKKNVLQHKNVLSNLIDFYSIVKNQLTPQKEKYLADFVSVVASHNYYILFSFKCSWAKCKELVEIDNRLKEYDLIYKSKITKTYMLWRKARYILYTPLCLWEHHKNKVKLQA